jgi:hypothetical protein
MDNPTGALNFTRFVIARHNVWVARDAGLDKPWTKDPILQSYRFCNMYRELDTVTQWLRSNWSATLGKHPDAWFAMVIARLVNHPGSLAHLNPKGWNPEQFKDTMQRMAHDGRKVFGSAYIVSTNGHALAKPVYLAHHVLDPLWENRALYRPRPDDTLASFHTRLTQANGLGSFMAAQVVADVKNSPLQSLSAATDWFTWAAPGPGSARGLARVANGDKDKKVPSKLFLPMLSELRKTVNQWTTPKGWKVFCAQDIQNCLCEFDKYERVRLGEGTPRQKYPGQ